MLLENTGAEILQHLNYDIRDDPIVVEIFVAHSWWAAAWASARLLCDRDFVNKIVAINGMTLKYVNPEFKDDYSIVMRAVLDSPLAIYHASDRLKDNSAVATVAVRGEGSCLKWLSDNIRANVDIVILAASNCARSFRYASSRIRKDRGVVKKLIEKQPTIFSHSELLGDMELALLTLSLIGDHVGSNIMYTMIRNSLRINVCFNVKALRVNRYIRTSITLPRHKKDIIQQYKDVTALLELRCLRQSRLRWAVFKAVYDMKIKRLYHPSNATVMDNFYMTD